MKLFVERETLENAVAKWILLEVRHASPHNKKFIYIFSILRKYSIYFNSKHCFVTKIQYQCNNFPSIAHWLEPFQ